MERRKLRRTQRVLSSSNGVVLAHSESLSDVLAIAAAETEGPIQHSRPYKQLGYPAGHATQNDEVNMREQHRFRFALVDLAIVLDERYCVDGNMARLRS